MPHLILMRHGNTFEAGQPPRRVGAATDLPLTEEGERQAAALAAFVEAHHAPVSAIISGPLQRTRRVAEILSQKTKGLYTLDERLCEINYGLWENKTDEEIRALYGNALLDAWEGEGAWPEAMNWAPSRKKVEHNVAAFLDEQRKALLRPEAKSRIAVTSNGILRFFHQALTGDVCPRTAKIKTGHYALATPSEEGWTVDVWNERPV